MTADVKSGLPHAVLATWGDVTLTPLDEGALEACGVARKSTAA
jgi:hypothetical protein